MNFLANPIKKKKKNYLRMSSSQIKMRKGRKNLTEGDTAPT